jgi:2-methylcitrate dehydratase PrpD
MDTHPTDRFADYVHRLRFEDLPQDVVESTKLVVLDYFASAMAGYKINKIFNEAIWTVVGGMGGKKESRVFFRRAKLPASNAAFLNAAYGHGADVDDGHRTAQGHPGVNVIPVALSLAEAHNIDGRDTITAIVAGYDIFVRLATAINPAHLSRGFHTTGTVGTIAAGGTAAKSLKLSRSQLGSALGLAALQAAGLLEVMKSGQMNKPFHPGKAAFNGILAARLAEAGSIAPREVFEGRTGFIKAFTDHADLDILLKDLGGKYSISSCYIKLYPACRHTHAAIDAAMSLRQGGVPTANSLEKVRIHIYQGAINLTGNIREPRTEDDAKFSLTYAVATALTKGHFTLQDLDVSKGVDSETRALISKIAIICDPRLENREANIRGARVELIMKDGTTREIEVKLPKGEPEVPALQKDIEAKLDFCGETLFDKERLKAIVRTVERLDSLTRMSTLTKLLVI